MHGAAAIVGMACRFPKADDIEEFWRFLAEGRDAFTPIPPERWTPSTAGNLHPRTEGDAAPAPGAFLDRVGDFDWRPFAISPREAREMDPQQRILLELTWRCFEDAGWPLERAAGSNTAVYFSLSPSDYYRLQSRDLSAIGAFTATGNEPSFAAHRVSAMFDLRGLTMIVGAGCASSLHGIHLALRSLRAGECDNALVGSARLILAQDTYVGHQQIGVLGSPAAGPLDAAGDGFVLGEGAGVILLRSLERALADGDRIYAVVRGSNVNHSGRSSSAMAVDQASQEAVIRGALADADIEPGEVDYVEMHAAGTGLGDAIEARAIAAVIGSEREAELPCAVGSLCGNLGHLMHASGIAHLIKVALGLRRRQLPPTIHVDRVHPHAQLSEGHLRLQRELADWDVPDGKTRVAGVASLSWGGANSHVVLQQAPRPSVERAAATSEHPQIVCLSGLTRSALLAQASSYLGWLERHARSSLTDIAFTSTAGRSHFCHRAALICDDLDQLRAQLRALAEQGEARLIGELPLDGQAQLKFHFGGWSDDGGSRKLAREIAGRGEATRWSAIVAEHAALRSELDAISDQAREVLGNRIELGPLESGDLRSPEARCALLALHTALARFVGAAGLVAGSFTATERGALGAAVASGELELAAALRIAAGGESSTAGGAAVAWSSAERELGLFAIGVTPCGREEPCWLGLTDADVSPRRRLLEVFGRAYVLGVTPAWRSLAACAGSPGRIITLPGYAFQRKHYWLPAVSAAAGSRPSATASTPGSAAPSDADSASQRRGAIAGDRTGRRSSSEEGTEHQTLEQQRRQMRQRVIDAVRQVLEFDASEPVSSRRPLHELGFTSAAAQHLRLLLSEIIGKPLRASIAYDYPTIDAIVEFLLEQSSVLRPAVRSMPAAGEPPAPPANAAAAALDLEGLEALSDEDVEQLLAAHLDGEDGE